jgi:hypothetical protein
MTNPATASTQYGDFKGTISLDGFNGLTVFDLIKKSDRTKDYWPIGIRIYGFSESGSSEPPSLPTVKAKVLCVDIDQTGLGPDKISEYCRNHRELHTFEFDAEIDVMDFLSQLKRLDIVLLERLVDDAEVRIQPIRD